VVLGLLSFTEARVSSAALGSRKQSVVPDDPESVIFHNRRTTNATEQALLHATLEPKNGDLWRRLGGAGKYL
jgi:hypothetical protein